jgi:hypothetical protein
MLNLERSAYFVEKSPVQKLLKFLRLWIFRSSAAVFAPTPQTFQIQELRVGIKFSFKQESPGRIRSQEQFIALLEQSVGRPLLVAPWQAEQSSYPEKREGSTRQTMGVHEPSRNRPSFTPAVALNGSKTRIDYPRVTLG